ncbi:MAG: FAD-dependent oxidoreductase, partial [Paracoccus sp. (in: a-proteobacteria)]|nr:FAD-dependent oxidoreductase [Paracoccus sp. (in: a-proteobacteria)]
MKKVAMFALLVIAASLAALILRNVEIDLDAIRDALTKLDDLRAASPLAMAAAFAIIYVAATALSLPLGMWLTLAGGALFGFWQGLVIVSFASTIGATLAFLAARLLLRDWVQARMGRHAEAIEAGIARDGAFYLFSIRLIPALPFFMVNLIMGLTAIRTATFYWVSQLGMLPATAVYINAGTQLGSLEGPGSILSVPILISLAALAVFPWLARALLNALRRRRAYRGWKRPRRVDRTLVVIGAGSAGLVASYLAAAVRARVTLVEAAEMGGDCLNTGCVPSKTLIRSAALAHQMRHAGQWGLADTPPAVPFRAVMARVRASIARIAPHDSVERYTSLGVEVLRGHARLVDPWTVEIAAADGTQRLTSRAVIVATGAGPAVPRIPGLDLVDALTSETLWTALADQDEPPARLMVLGGGPVGCELAQAFARLGSHVVLVEKAPRLLPREEAEISARLAQTLQAEGVELLTGYELRAFGRDDRPWADIVQDGRSRRVPFDRVIMATGREARLAGFGLEDLGIANGHKLPVNAFMQTQLPNIFAAGDVAGPLQFTHVAAHQAGLASLNALLGGLWRFRIDYRVIPYA